MVPQVDFPLPLEQFLAHLLSLLELQSNMELETTAGMEATVHPMEAEGHSEVIHLIQIMAAETVAGLWMQDLLAEVAEVVAQQF
jgi:hypothetical protein